MRTKKKAGRIVSLTLSAAVWVSGFAGLGGVFNTAEAAGGTPSITVDMADKKHGIVHGAAGFLYGISNEGVPDVNTLTPLKPKVLATKGALGTEHPYGDALDVAEEFFEAGGLQVQMYNSNYYGVFGVTAEAHDYADVLTNIICPAVVEWKDKMRGKFPDIDNMLQYIPINESTPINVRDESTGAVTRNYNEAWRIYYEAIKEGDPEASIVGPNHSYNPSYDEMYNYLCFCRDNNCLPDVITWHELDTKDLSHLDVNAGETSIEQYRKAAAAAGVEEKQVVINEYADFSDCGVPGRLVNWISRLEDNEVYGCLPFWHQANNLNDLAASANEGNGAWWVYKKYGDMTGTTLSVTQSNTTYDGFYGVAAIDENKRSAAVLCGGVDGGARIDLKNIDKTDIFSDDDIVHVKVEAAYFTGYHGAATDTVTVLDGTLPAENGSVSIELENTLFSTAYYVTITETDEEAKPVTESYRAEYEAEDARFFGSLIVDEQYSPLESPSYYCSGGRRVGGIDAEGEGIEYTVNIPYDGKYKLDFIYGNGVGSARNNASRHKPLNITQKLIIDGEEKIIELPSTLFYSMESMVTEYADLPRGRHKIALKYNGEAGAFHDVLVVSNAGACGEKPAAFHKIYEAEQADFNEFNSSPKAAAENTLPGFSGSGYVTGLKESQVESGGGIRFVAAVEESGMYNINYRYMSSDDGKLRLYLDNTNITYTNHLTDISLKACDTWEEAHTTVYLRKGINIIDADSTSDTAVDYMEIFRAAEDNAVTVEAESGTGNFTTAVSGDKTYVESMLGSSDARENNYLEITADVPDDGLYKMRVFQSNNDLCGTHSYNIKIIDKYAAFEVNGDKENAKRYFFTNSFSDDTFLEKSVPLELKAGENKIRIYNDDSWHVKWGGSKSEPGTNELVNYTPNFDKFIIEPAVSDAPLNDEGFTVRSLSTANGYIYTDKTVAHSGDKVTVYMIPDGVAEKVTVNGGDVTDRVTTDDNRIYSLDFTVTEDTFISAEFSDSSEGAYKAVADDNEYVWVGGSCYKISGENLFKNGDFSDNSGQDMEQWFTGTNESGHPTADDYAMPKINKDGTAENLIPLTESGILTTGVYEPADRTPFYYGKNSTGTYLVENVSDTTGEEWRKCAWNGTRSLLGYVPIKENTRYYFKYKAWSSGGSASVRYGAIDMDEGDGFYIPQPYATNQSLNFCGTGYLSCNNGDMQNTGGSARYYETVIDSGVGADYFLFNAYWLHVPGWYCATDFELRELAGDPLTVVTAYADMPVMEMDAGNELLLPDTVRASAENGTEYELKIDWLNADGVKTYKEGAYTVTGYINVPDGLYCEDRYIKQRVLVNGNSEPPSPSPIPTAGVIARYDFEEESLDDIDAVFNGGCQIISDETLQSRTLRTDGSGGTYMEIPAPKDEDGNTLERYTVSFDFLNNTTGNYFNFYIGDGSSNSSGINYFGVKFGEYLLLSSKDGSEERKQLQQTPECAGGWHHAAVTVSDGEAKVYIDKKLYAELSGYMMSEIKAELIRFSFSAWSKDKYADAYYDNIVIYNDALSAEAVAAEGEELIDIVRCEADGGTLGFEYAARYDISNYDVYTAVYNDGGVLLKLIKNQLEGSADITEDASAVKVLVWERDTMNPVKKFDLRIS